MRRLARLLRSIGADERAVSVIELAVVAPFLAVIAVGISDFSMALSERHALQQVVQRTLQLASLGARDGRYDHLQRHAAEAAGVPDANVTITIWLECDGVQMPDFDHQCQEGEQIARYVQVRIEDSYTPMFGAALFSSATDGTVLLRAEAALRVQ